MMGGGARLGAMRSDELHVWGKKEFSGLYAEVARRSETSEARKAVGPSSLPQDARKLVEEVLGRGGT